MLAEQRSSLFHPKAGRSLSFGPHPSKENYKADHTPLSYKTFAIYYMFRSNPGRY